MKLPSAFERYLDAIEAEIRSLLAERNLPLYDMMRYHLGWVDEHGRPLQSSTGKGLRPTLCLLACEATCDNYQNALPAAASVELLHNFSLIQDDIQDDDRERRHRPTVWSIWGKPQAINAATAMHVLANLALSRLEEHSTPFHKQQRAQSLLYQCCLRLIEGQYWDISYEKRLDIDVDDYLNMIERKTAELIACSLELGALLGTDNEHLIAGFRNFGRNLGLAFQIRDDIMGIWGAEKDTGKPVASDIRRKKKSFPIVYALENTAGGAKAELMDIYKGDDIDGNGVDKVLMILEAIGAKAQAQRVADRYCEQALKDIEGMAISPQASASLREMARFLVEREF